MDQLSQIIGYCYAAIFGVLGVMLIIFAFMRWWRHGHDRTSELHSFLQMAIGAVLMLLSLFVLNW